MDKIYSRINWENYPSENTAINEENLNKMDSAINALDNRIVSQEASKLSKESAINDIVDWSMDESTGIITITRRSGEKIIFDLNIEKIPVDFRLSDDGILSMTTEDGTIFTANIGAMIPVLTFSNSEDILVSVTGEGINKTYSFSIKNSSVTEDKLQPNFLADVKVESAKALSSSIAAATSEVNSSSSAQKSESYAIGGTGTRDSENTDNAKYYKEQAEKALAEMQKSQVTGVKGENEEEYRLGNVNITSQDVGAVPVGGDISGNTVKYTSNDVEDPNAWGSVDLLSTGETQKTFMEKISTMVKNVRYLYKKLGTTDISSIGDGTVSGAIGKLNSNLKWKYLGYKKGMEAFDLATLEYQELHIIINDNRVKRDDVISDLGTINILKSALNNIPKQFVVQSSYGTSSNDIIMQIRATLSSVNLHYVRTGDTVLTTTSTMSVYYR